MKWALLPFVNEETISKALLCTLGSSFRERSKGREGRIMLEDLKAPYSSHIALFQKHEEEGGGRGAPSPGVP